MADRIHPNYTVPDNYLTSTLKEGTTIQISSMLEINILGNKAVLTVVYHCLTYGSLRENGKYRIYGTLRETANTATDSAGIPERVL